MTLRANAPYLPLKKGYHYPIRSLTFVTRSKHALINHVFVWTMKVPYLIVQHTISLSNEGRKMKKLCSLMMLCGFLFAFSIISVEAHDALKPNETTAKKIVTNKTRKAKPVEMPQATSKRDQVSATGFHDREEGEETQELKPNILDKKATKTIKLQHNPVQKAR